MGYSTSYLYEGVLEDLGRSVAGGAVALVISIILGIAVYFVFLSPRNDGKFHGFAGWLYEFLNFRRLLLDSLLRIIYIIASVWIVLGGFINLFVGYGSFGARFLAFLLSSIFGNIALRLVYEFIMMLVIICRNVGDINRKMGGGQQPVPPQRPQPPQPPQNGGFRQPQRPVPPQQPPQQPASPVRPAQNQAPSGAVFEPERQPSAGSPAPERRQEQSAFEPEQQSQPAAAVKPGGSVVFCRHCGQQFSSDEEACPNCGTRRM
ncbi:MAG TPA: hypothetical protein IAB22_05790 [Candidatus Merdivicinus intestinavium]|nr:hypothetical protein [Candidatus Merdivicinus intestinavium]